jgi:hypothetical protein
VSPSSVSMIPTALLRILNPEDAGTTLFFDMSVNIYNLVWHTLSDNVNLNINFVCIRGMSYVMCGGI